MTAHDWYVEHRTDYTARILDQQDVAKFDEHLPQCEECRREIARLEADLAWLPMGVAPVTPRPGLERRIVQQALDGTLRRRWQWLLPTSLAAGLLLSAAAWYGRGQRIGDLARALDARTLHVAALEDTLSVMRTAAKVMQASIERAGREGGLVIFADPVSHRWNVVVHGLPPAPPNGRYQFWFICAEGMVRGAEVQADPTKPVMFTTGMPSTGGDVVGAALTVEPLESKDGPPQGEMLAHLML
jgi:hypothetical protein